MKLTRTIRIVLGLLVVLVVIVVVALGMIDSLAKRGVESGATYALGVETTVDDLDLSLMGGSLRMDGLTVSNPEGYQTPHMMKSGRFNLAVRIGSVFGETVELPHFELDGLDINIEQKLMANNISEILENLNRFESQEPAEKKPGKRVKIDRVLIKDVVANVQMAGAGEAGRLSVKVPTIELENVSSDNADGILISELTARLVMAVLAAVVEQGGDIIPADTLKAISGGVSGLATAIGGNAANLARQATDSAAEAIKEQAGKLTEEAEKAGETLKKGLGDLLKGKDDSGE